MKFFAYALGAAALAAVALADSKEDLLKDSAKLRGEAAGVIEKLKSEGKHVLATEILVIEHEVEVLEKKVHDFHPQTSIGQIGLHAAENVLHSLELKLKHKIEDLSHNFDSSKEDLQKDAAKLKAEAGSAIEKAKKEGKHVLADEIKILETEIESIEKRIEKFHPQTPIGTIGLHAVQKILHDLEEKMKHKMAELNKTFDSSKEDLAKDAAKLKAEAGSAIEKAKKEGKHVLAEEIQHLETEIVSIEKRIENFHPQTTIGQIGLHAIQNILHGLEERMKHKMADLNKDFDSKEDLAKDAAKLKEQAGGAIALAKSQGKHLLAHEIEILEKEIELIEHKIEGFHPQTPIGQIGLHAIQSVLHGLEERMKHKMADLNKDFDSTKEDLQKDAAKLKAEAGGVIEKLKKEGKHVLAAEIEVIEKEVEVLEHKVEGFHPTSSIGQTALHAAEAVLHGLEARLKHKIEDLNKNFENSKEELAKDAAKLKGEAAGAIALAKSQGKHLLAEELTTLEKAIEKVEHTIEMAHPQTEIGKVAIHAAETVLKGLEAKMKAKIEALNH